jgi:peptidoglycan/xylan/chitin deacetylase (PgdA/CDA1 family)
VPSFRQQLETIERWRRFPALERLDGARMALTFDDGPDPDATPAVLEALAAAGATGTFFLVGEQVEAHPGLAVEVAAGGHSVGLHGYRHLEHDGLADPRADLERGAAALAEATGERPVLFRPPYGRFSEASYAACRERGLSPVYWSAWGGDWEPIPARGSRISSSETSRRARSRCCTTRPGMRTARPRPPRRRRCRRSWRPSRRRGWSWWACALGTRERAPSPALMGLGKRLGPVRAAGRRRPLS